MKRNFAIGLLFTLVAVLFSYFVYADDVPHEISYQGYVTSGGSAYTGTGYFKFALVNSDESATYWSNDGTVDGSEPSAYVSTTVSSGVFNIILGNTSESGTMNALEKDDFNQEYTMYLRVWFCTTAGGTYEELSPNKKIVASAYAINCDGFDNTVMTSLTLDSDNAGSGADITITANQGTDSDGGLKYSASNNRWEISNDGGAYAAIGTGSGSGTVSTGAQYYLTYYPSAGTTVDDVPGIYTNAGGYDTLIFEGSTANDYETSLVITDPTGSDKTITFPNATGTVSLLDATETLENKTLTSPDINGGTVDNITSLTVGADVDIGGYALRAASLTADGLTSSRVVFASTDGLLTDDSDLTFATDTLTATKIGATQLAGAMNCNNENMTNVDIDSGAIDATTIGASSATSGKFTSLTSTLGATEKVYIDGRTTRTATTELLDIDATIDTTTATDIVTSATIEASRAAGDTGGTRGLNTSVTTGNMANAGWSYNYGGTYNSTAADTATSSAAVFYAGTSSVSSNSCTDYGLYIASGYDYGVNTESALEANGGAVFNEDSADVDFRIETNDLSDGFDVDANENTFGFGTNASSSAFIDIDRPDLSANFVRRILRSNGFTQTITGNVAMDLKYNEFAKSTITAADAYTVQSATTVYIENAPAAAGSATITLPLALWVDDGGSQFDGFINFNLPDTASIIITPSGTGTLIDYALETEWTTGYLINADFGGATVLSGSIAGIDFDFQSSVTATNQSARGYNIALPAATNTGSSSYTYKGYEVSGGAIDNTHVGGTTEWNGMLITMPATTQTNGSTMAVGIEITGGAVTSGTANGIYINMNATTDDAINVNQGTVRLGDDIPLVIGGSQDTALKYDTGETADALKLGLSTDSRNLVVCEKDDLATDFAHAQQTNPTIYIQSSDSGTTTDYISFAHDQTDGVINVGTGDIKFSEDIKADKRILGKKGSDVAAAANITLGDGNYFDINGATAIETILTTGWTAGSVVTLQFDADPVVRHNTGSGARIYLQGAANFAASANDTLTLIYDGTYWREISRSVI